MRQNHAVALFCVRHLDVQQPDIQRTVDAEPETLPGQCRMADGDSERARLGVDHLLQALHEPRQVKRPLRQAPRNASNQDAGAHTDQQQQRAKTMQEPTGNAYCLTRKPPHDQPSGRSTHPWLRLHA